MEAASAALPEENEAPLLRSVLLHDRTGRIQVILPENGLLDLKSIKEQTGRELVAIGKADLHELYETKRLKKLTDFPVLNNVTTIIDETVLADELRFPCLTEGKDAPRIITLEDLKEQLIEHEHDVLDMEVAVESTEMDYSINDPEENEGQIVHSLKSFTSLRIKQRLEDTLEIPTLPATAQRIIQLKVNPNAVVSELAEIVESDPSLAAQVVSWAASPYYAAPGKIRSVQDAIVRVLGFDLVGNLALGLALGKTLELPKDKVDGLTPYWLQSIYCSTLVEAIVKLIPNEMKPSKGLTYLSGLLHNFGYLVLAHIFPPHFSQICRYLEANPHVSHMAIEHHLLQITREQICVWLMDLWNMPEEIGIAIRYQHDPNYSDKHCAYPNLIFMAMRLLRQEGIGDAPLEEVPDFLYDRYDLTEEQVLQTVKQVVESTDEINAMASNFPG
ncbi:MAG: HDOD domain-containing protein [Pseudomonadales bacterium]|nr:HDOD domain-containing protein [Pseudomonadales bacterium]